MKESILVILMIFLIMAIYVGAVGIVITWITNVIAGVMGFNTISYTTGMVISVLIFLLRFLLK